MTPSSRNKEPASAMADIPYGFDSMDRAVPDDPAEHGSIPDSGKFLKPKIPYPLAGKALSCFDFRGLDDADVQYLTTMFRKTARESPGTWIKGAKDFPACRAGLVEFWRTAGFSEAHAVMLAGDAPLAEDVEDDEPEPTVEELAEVETELAAA